MISRYIPGMINEYFGKSTDTKPITNEPNGSFFYEMDTHDVYAFDADTQTWEYQFTMSDE